MSNTVSHEKYCLISNIKKVSKIRKSMGINISQLKFNLEFKSNKYYSPLITNNPTLLLVTNVIKKV